MVEYHAGSALIVVDVQNDFADPAGSLAVEGAGAIIPIVNQEIVQATDGGALVVLTQDWHPASTPHFVTDGGIWPVHCVAETWGAALHPALAAPDDSPTIRKGVNGEDGYSGFAMRDAVSGETISTGLEALLRDRDVTDVAVCGLATDYCVMATALDAAALGFSTSVLIEAIAAVGLEPGDGARAIDAMRDAGVELERSVLEPG